MEGVARRLAGLRRLRSEIESRPAAQPFNLTAAPSPPDFSRHHRAIKALRNPLQEKNCRLGLGLLDGSQWNSVTELVTVLDS